MVQIAFLYLGDNVPSTKRDENMKDLYSWMDTLGKTKKVVQMGAPFAQAGKVLQSDGKQLDYDSKKASDVTGYTIVEAASLEEAIALTKGCPQLNPLYGKGSLEVRTVIPM